MSEIIRYEKQGDRCDIFVSGEIDLSNSGEVRKTVLGALNGASVVTVNLANVSYIDSSGIAALVEGLQLATSKNKEFTLNQPSKQVKSILELARLDQVFTIV